MLKSLHCISLRTVKYNDRNNILTVYTREEGRMSFVLPAGSSREARRRRAMTMPLMAFECEADLRPSRELSNIRDVRPSLKVPGLLGNPVKMSIAMFLAEVLNAVLRESQPDELTFNYIAFAVEALDEAPARATANFPLMFMYRLGRFLGIEPDTSGYRPGRVFDMLDGTFRDSAPLHRRFLEGEEAAAVRTLSRLTWENYGKIGFNRRQRQRMLDGIIDYYSVHYTSLAGLNSLEVMRELFD